MSAKLRDRILFTPNHVKPFTKFMEAKGYKSEEPKGNWEALRFRSYDNVISFYRRKGRETLTSFGEGLGLFKEYIEKEKADA